MRITLHVVEELLLFEQVPKGQPFPFPEIELGEVGLGRERQAEETLVGFEALATSVVDDGAARCAGVTGCVDYRVGLRIFDEDDQ